MAQDWDIRPRSDACHRCGRSFGEGERLFSALQFGSEGYGRVDHCDACWAKREAGFAAFSAWQSVFRSPPPRPEEPLAKETAESLLRNLMETGGDARRNVIYVLAVMLERKKILVERDVRTDETGATTRVYEHRRTGDVFLIPEPRLRLDQLESVQQEVLGLLGARERPAAAVADAAPAQPAAPTDPVAAGKAAGLREGFYSRDAGS
jgi:hypothetical protein